MPTSTSRLSLVQPVGTDAVAELRESIAANATSLDAAALYGSGTFTNRSSAAAIDGDLYESTDVDSLSYYSAATSAWTPLLQLVPVGAAVNTTLKNGQLAHVSAGGVTITLPTATPGTIVGVWNFNGTGSSPTTVTGTGGISGLGVTSSTAWLMGATGQACIFSVNVNGNWVCVSGQYDTGWVALRGGVGMGTLSGFEAPAARCVGDMVDILGGYLASGTVGGGATVATLPSGMAPAGSTMISAIIDSGGNINPNIMLAQPAGILTSVSGFNGGDYVLFNGRYRLGS